MARIIGGIGTSHVPTIAMAFDKGKQDDPDWKPLFKGYEAVAKWLAEKKPDVLFFCFNDHATSFFFDHYPTFALGVSDEYRIADEGLGQRPIPRLKGHAPMARHIAQSLIAEEFDLSVFQDIALDHGLHSPRRHRGRRSDHVAHHARRARRSREEDPRQLLPADDHRHGGGAL